MKKFLLFATALISATVRAEENGGINCAGCTAIIGLVEQVAQVNAIPVTNAISQVCEMLPSPYNTACTTLIYWYGPGVIKMLEEKYTADVICNTVGLCNSTNGKICRLFPLPKAVSPNKLASHIQEAKAKYDFSKIAAFDKCDYLPALCDLKKSKSHTPFYDDDGDLFSTYETLRGDNWRGRDCDDTQSSVFPGRFDSDVAADHNCNGIYGVDPETNQAYEDQWCKGTGQMGVAILGDSATAHFRIPPTYLTAKTLSLGTFSGLLRNIENELDFPMLSWSTGHVEASVYAPDIDGPMDSIYKRLRDNNLCNNNDYQNLGVNGANSGDLLDFGTILSRDADSSALPTKPLLLFMAMIGNDVCNKQVTSKTTPEEYHQNVLKSILELDPRLPKGTKVVLIGLVDGRILYDSMHDRIHPIGSTNNDVTFGTFYDYLNCLEVSPCAGWMNSDESVRDALSATAEEMRNKLPIVIEETRGQLENIEVFYLGDVLNDAIHHFLSQDGNFGWQIIETSDGFHPNQLG